MKYQINQGVRHAKSGDGTIIYIDRLCDTVRAYAVRFEKADNSHSDRVATGAGPCPYDDWDEEYCAWMRESELTPIDEPIMVYASNVSERDAEERTGKYKKIGEVTYNGETQHICINTFGRWHCWKYIVPTASIKKPTIKRSEIEAAKSLLAKIESGDFELED